jgi:hypothetical protein
VVLTLEEKAQHEHKGAYFSTLAEMHEPHWKHKGRAKQLNTRGTTAERDLRRRLKLATPVLNYLMLATTLCMMAAQPTMPEGPKYFTTHSDGEIRLPGINGECLDIIPFHALLDTGASNSNYISSEYYDKYAEKLQPYLSKIDSSVTLGDKKTVVKLDKMVTVPVRFYDSNGWAHESDISLVVLESRGRDVIIGMPSLITDFGEMFKQMISSAVDRYYTGPTPQPPVRLSSLLVLEELSAAELYHKAPLELEAVKPNEPNKDPTGLKSPYKDPGTIYSKFTKMLKPPVGCTYPWAVNIDIECLEDRMIPEAISNSAHLEHLTQSYDAELEFFHSEVKDHVCKDFKLHKEAVALIKANVASFVKRKWEGLNLPAIEVKFKDTLPARLKPYTPRIPENLLAHSEKEIKRMLTYFYVPCESPWASPLTVAPKATDPFIRLCVNLRRINSYVEFGHFQIPNVKGTLEKLLPYKFFCDIDLKSSFHQMKLALDSSMKLSVQTPWGQFRPVFVPEGLCQASQNLQECMTIMFGTLGDWCSVLFDNILIGGRTEEELLENLTKFLDKAAEYNVYLKIQKTWIGFSEVKFFGYKVIDGKYYLEDSRAEAIDRIPFPSHTHSANNLTAMRSFLGQTRIFQPHVPDYTAYAAPLEQMTSSKFDWDRTKWQEDFQGIFEKFKVKLKDAMVLFMPDYSKEWIMRTDASNYGYGGVLYQVGVIAGGVREYQPLVFISKKWTDPATRWDTITQECFGIFACVKECAHLLRAKPFIIETDHANLRSMEQSLVPKIIRQCLYLRSFTCWVRHIPGKSNTADYWSRLQSGEASTLESLYLLRGSEPPSPRDEGLEQRLFSALCSQEDQDMDFWHDETWLEDRLNAIQQEAKASVVKAEELPGKTAQELFDSVHGGVNLHQGVRRTWLLLNKLYPAHRIPITKVHDMVDECAMCQKYRLGMRDSLEPVPRVLKPLHHRSTVGVDTVTITPESKEGHKAIITVVNHYTHHVFLHKVKKYDAESVADALMVYIGNFGLFDQLISDPGSDLTSKAVMELNKWLGVRHIVSLVDVHTSNGCENTNKQIITHLSALCSELRVKDKWDDPKILALIQLHFNGQISSEAGITPLQAMFGSVDDIYYKLKPDLKPDQFQTEYVQRLDDVIRQLRQISAKHQNGLFNKRIFAKPFPHQFVVGDMVLRSVRTPTKRWKPEKLGPAFYGPYTVEHVHKNDYTCRHITEGTVHKFSVDMIKPYFGTKTMAKRAALLDFDQYVVTAVLHYTGDPSVRTSLEFFIRFSDGDEHWQVYDRDLLHCEAFDDYCRSVPELWPLLHTDPQYRKVRTQLNKEPITELKPGDIIYVDLRSLDPHWYNNLLPGLEPNLPDEDKVTYVVPYLVGSWKNAQHTKVAVSCALLQHSASWNHDKVKSWGSYSEVQAGQVLVDDEFLSGHPDLLRTYNLWRAATDAPERTKKFILPTNRQAKLQKAKAKAQAKEAQKPARGRPKLITASKALPIPILRSQPATRYATRSSTRV